MNFNVKIEPDQAFVLHTQEDQLYDNDILKSSDNQNRIQIKPKIIGECFSKGAISKGKQNDCLNTAYSSNKNVVTNHSFNGFFNQNTHKQKNSINESINKKSQLTNCQVNSPTNINSTGKLSNLQFVNDSSKNYDYQENMHSQVISFVKKYFTENYQSGNLYGKYVTIEHLVQILFEEFQNLIGKQNSFNLVQQFSNKIFLIFGDKIYFDDLFERTYQTGLTGLIFEIFKSIKQDQKQNQQFIQNKNLLKPSQTIQSKKSFSNKSIINSNFNNSFKNQKSSQLLDYPSEKINLDQFFGKSVSKIQFHDQQQYLHQDQSTIVNEQNLDDIKQILQDYIESMYEEAELKLNKKYAQQIKKITLKYKETQKLLQKVNQKISNHYDSIQLQKQYEKKLKLANEKELELENKIKKLEYELKSAKDDTQKQKLTSFKLDQDMNKLKQKLQKYQNAIFERAMQKGSNQNSVNCISGSNTSSMIKQMKTNNSIYSQQGTPVYQQKIAENPRFEVKIDTVTEHRPLITTHSTYTPYVSRHINGGMTPTRIQQIQRTSVSPIKQRISFIKTQNPALNMRIVNANQRSVSPINNNSRIMYSTNTNVGQNQRLKISTVQKVQFGQKIQLRPLSPIGKLGEICSGVNNISSNQQVSNTSINSNIYAQRSYSPIKVQFCTSRVSNLPTQNR